MSELYHRVLMEDREREVQGLLRRYEVDQKRRMAQGSRGTWLERAAAWVSAPFGGEERRVSRKFR